MVPTSCPARGPCAARARPSCTRRESRASHHSGGQEGPPIAAAAYFRGPSRLTRSAEVSTSASSRGQESAGLAPEVATSLAPRRKLSDVLQIRGGARLEGHVHISGAKNSVLALIAGALLTEQEVAIHGVPSLVDVENMLRVVISLGATARVEGDVLTVAASHLTTIEPDHAASQSLRASFLAIGPLLARTGIARIPLPGGCEIGLRPVDLHIRGLRALGAEILVDGDVVDARVQGPLQGADIFLDFPSVGATETLIMAASLAEGDTRITNAAREPEIVELADLLTSMGARISGAGTGVVTVRGVESLSGTEFTALPDRIEAATFLIAGAITRTKELTLAPVVPAHLAAVSDKLACMGCDVSMEEPHMMRIRAPEVLHSTHIKAYPYPGFPTDAQPQVMALLTTCEGTSIVKDTVFEDRMKHCRELRKMGASITAHDATATVLGSPNTLRGAHVQASDLRAGAALILAGLAADGESTLTGMRHVDRGYARLDAKLASLGADLWRA